MSSIHTQTRPMTVAETTLGAKNSVRARVESGQRWLHEEREGEAEDDDTGHDDQAVEDGVLEGDGDPLVVESAR